MRKSRGLGGRSPKAIACATGGALSSYLCFLGCELTLGLFSAVFSVWIRVWVALEPSAILELFSAVFSVWVRVWVALGSSAILEPLLAFKSA